MFVDGVVSGFDLVRQMKLGDDLQNSWIMFDYIKHVQGWMTTCGLSCLSPNLLQGHDNCVLWHAIQRHGNSMHFVEKDKHNCWKERIRYAHFQGVHGG